MVFMSRSRRAISLLAAASSVLLGAACGSSGGTGTAASEPGQLNIVAAFYPFQFVAERVAGPYATVSNLTSPGAEPHDLELTPRQVAELSTADLVIYQQSFQAAVDEAVEQSGVANALDTATVVALQPLDPPDAHDHGHGDAEHGDAGDEDEHGELDPHVWLDPTQLGTIATEVARRLGEIEPAHQADFDANARALTDQLGTLDQEFRQGLSNCARQEFVTTHAAFGYLARRYQLEQLPISGLSPESEPSPARLAEIQQETREHQITTIFYETLVSPAVAESLAADLGLQTDVLDPIEGITDQSRGTDYVAVMQANLAALKKANECR
jgi:zinc transport system substrate-binding protein